MISIDDCLFQLLLAKGLRVAPNIDRVNVSLFLVTLPQNLLAIIPFIALGTNI